VKYNLTEQQKELARLLVKEVRAGRLAEHFYANREAEQRVFIPELRIDSEAANVSEEPSGASVSFGLGAFDVLAESKLLVQTIENGNLRACTLAGLMYRAVDSEFADEEVSAPISTLAQPHPPEIAMSLDRLRELYPDPKKTGFLIMRFTATKPYERIVATIMQTADICGLKVLRADSHEFHSDLLSNIRTYLHGCGFGIAVYERIQTDEPNANVGLEVGYLMAMNKPVLLLKDQTLPDLPSDLAGKLYKRFDPHDPENTIPPQLTKWLQDYGIFVPSKK
jgi:hypothetical protein